MFCGKIPKLTNSDDVNFISLYYNARFQITGRKMHRFAVIFFAFTLNQLLSK